MRDLFLKTLMTEAAANKNAMLLTGDLGFGVLDPFIKAYPDRYLNVGVAEQNMIGLATGLAHEGRRVVAYSIGNFPTLRPLEQIRNDVLYHNADVKIVCVGGGFSYGALGMSHHATEDLSILRALPNLTMLTPATDQETIACTEYMMRHAGPCYLRLERSSAPIPAGGDDAPVEIGKVRTIREGQNITFIGAGGVLGAAIGAADLLEKGGLSTRVLSVHSLKPLDKDTIIRAAKDTEVLITVEENTVIGGLGGAIAEICMEAGVRVKFHRAGIPDTYTATVGDQNYLKDLYGLNAEALAQTAQKLLNRA
ncbi:MAG TPA: transketolase C-terminal domain-containing protein [Alphaproteobacteria bacterium]